MNGLLLKDAFILKKFYLSMIPIILLYAVFQLKAPESSIMSTMIVLFGVMASQSTFSFDEMSKWDHYILSSPLTRKVIVKSKYVFSLINLLLAVLLGSVTNFIFLVGLAHKPVKDSILVNFACCAFGLIYLALTIPLFIKFGQEKARMFVVPIIMLPVAGILLLNNSEILNSILFLSPEILRRVVLFAPAAAFLLLILSYFISVSIYEKKEF